MSATENHNTPPSKRPSDSASQLVKFTDVALRMGVTIALGTWAGYWLDKKLNTSKPYFTLSLSLLSTVGAMYMVIKSVSQRKS